jgi:hypothetical protein
MGLMSRNLPMSEGLPSEAIAWAERGLTDPDPERRRKCEAWLALYHHAI